MTVRSFLRGRRPAVVTPEPAVEEQSPDPFPSAGSDEGYFFVEWLAFGFSPEEALGLLHEGLSPSAVREFCKHNPDCDVRTAVAILL